MILNENNHHKQAQFNGLEPKGNKEMISSNTRSKDTDEKNEMVEFIRKRFDNNYDSDRKRILRLIHNKLYTNKISSAAKELEALLRKCTYPKRNLIR